MQKEREPNPSMMSMYEKNAHSCHKASPRVADTGHAWFHGSQPVGQKLSKPQLADNLD